MRSGSPNRRSKSVDGSPTGEILSRARRAPADADPATTAVVGDPTWGEGDVVAGSVPWSDDAGLPGRDRLGHVERCRGHHAGSPGRGPLRPGRAAVRGGAHRRRRGGAPRRRAGPPRGVPALRGVLRAGRSRSTGGLGDSRAAPVAPGLGGGRGGCGGAGRVVDDLADHGPAGGPRGCVDPGADGRARRGVRGARGRGGGGPCAWSGGGRGREGAGRSAQRWRRRRWCC